jgi:CTP-dependent riboflavin kinase
MFDAWARATGITLCPGTLNLCFVVPVELPPKCLSLEEAGCLAPPHRQAQVGFQPRLYPVKLNRIQDAWLFRWSAPEALTTFVGEADHCSPERRCEIIAEVHLRSYLQLEDGSELVLEFV